MSTPHLGTPVHVHQNNQVGSRPDEKSATGGGIIALALSTAALVTAPVFILIPYVGFLPALLAAAAIVAAGVGLRGSDPGIGLAVTGLVVSVVLFALLAGLATVWNLGVAHPAISDYDQFHDALERAQCRIVGC